MCGALAHVRHGLIANSLRWAPVRMSPGVCAPAQALEVEVLRVTEEVPQLHEEAVGYVPQPKDSDVLTPALRAARTHGVLGAGFTGSSHASDDPHVYP